MKTITIYHLNTGSCNGCDIEFLAAIREYNSEKYKFKITDDPKKAKIILITGVVTSGSKNEALKVLKNTKVKILAIGSCGNSCGIFAGSYSVVGPIDKYKKPNLYIAGCPPKPEIILESIFKLIGIKEHINNKDLNGGIRGKLNYSPDICIACMTCVKVCPARAIDVKPENGGLKFSYNLDKCVFCGLCEDNCPTKAIRLTNDCKMIEKSRGKLKTEGITTFKRR